MPTIQCPQCDKPLAVKELTPGKKVRCLGCQSVFPMPPNKESAPKRGRPRAEEETEVIEPRRRPPVRDEDERDEDEEADDRPRKKKRPSKSGGSSTWLILGGVGALVVIAAVVVVIVLNSGGSQRDGDKDIAKEGAHKDAVINGGPAAGNAKVTWQNFAKIYAGLTQAKTEAILGQGRPATVRDLDAIYRFSKETVALGFRPGATWGEFRMEQITEKGYSAWTMWADGNKRIFVCFHPHTPGDPRVVGSLWVEGGPQGVKDEFGVHPLAMQSLADIFQRHRIEEQKTEGPKFLRGAAVKPLIAGAWIREEQKDKYEFHGGGKATHTFGFGPQKIKYQIFDDGWLELEEPRLDGDGVLRTMNYVVGNESAIYMMTIRAGNPLVLGPFTRPKS